MASLVQCRFLLFAVVALCSLITSVLASEDEASASDPIVVTIAECHSWGFDPSSLSCDTCSLLKASPLAQFEQGCFKCCQNFRPNPVVNPNAVTGSFVGRYKLAVLRYDPDSIDSYDEVSNFLNNDKAEVLKEKGSKAFTMEKVDNSNDYAHMHGLMGFFGGMRQTPPTIHFYKNHNGGKVGEADEEVSLRGFKREDIKDMLMTVLPS